MQEPFDRRAWAYAMLYVNLYGPQLLYSSRKFGQVILTRTVSPKPKELQTRDTHFWNQHVLHLYVTVSGKTTLLAEIEKVGFLLPMDSINTRLCCGTSS